MRRRGGDTGIPELRKIPGDKGSKWDANADCWLETLQLCNFSEYRDRRTKGPALGRVRVCAGLRARRYAPACTAHASALKTGTSTLTRMHMSARLGKNGLRNGMRFASAFSLCHGHGHCSHRWANPLLVSAIPCCDSLQFKVAATYPHPTCARSANFKPSPSRRPGVTMMLLVESSRAAAPGHGRIQPD